MVLPTWLLTPWTQRTRMDKAGVEHYLHVSLSRHDILESPLKTSSKGKRRRIAVSYIPNYARVLSKLVQMQSIQFSSVTQCPTLCDPMNFRIAGDTSSNPWSGRIPHAEEQLSPNWPCAVEPGSHNNWSLSFLEPILQSKRSHCNETPTHRN